MAKSGFKPGAIDRFAEDVLAVVSVQQDFIGREKNDPQVIKALIESAMSGVGPGGTRYKPIQEPYRSRKKREGGNSSRFMWGLRRGGLHMLARAHFAWKKLGKASLQLVWTATGKTGDYAEVHNEGEGKMPKREWMQLQSPDTAQAVDDLLGGILENNTKAFNRKYK